MSAVQLVTGVIEARGLGIGVWVLFAVAAVLALTDWWAVAGEHRPVELFAKPATMLPLIVSAAAMPTSETVLRGWFVVGLVCSLVGDVFLMSQPPERWFVPGLAAFLVGHLAYIVGLLAGGVDRVAVVIGAVMVVAAVFVLGPKVLAGARREDPRLVSPVAAYIGVISVMVVCAIGSTVWLAILGAVLFYLSDLCIGWSSFVGPFRHSRLVIITTYHLAQALLVASIHLSR
ncbi:MAG: lysoplasmalogenase [Microthrixaceae bacterium]